MMMNIYVNILNEGMIPWIKKEGPLFGYPLSCGVYDILKRDPRVKMKIIHSKHEADVAREEYLASKEEKKPIILNEVIPTEPVVEEVKVVEVNDSKTVEAVISEEPITLFDTLEVAEVITNDDLEIDKILDETPVVETAYSVNLNNKETEKIKSYTDEELSEMTKAQMKEILKSRGYTSGPYSGKYHDTVEELKEKVKRTQ